MRKSCAMRTCSAGTFVHCLWDKNESKIGNFRHIHNRPSSHMIPLGGNHRESAIRTGIAGMSVKWLSLASFLTRRLKQRRRLKTKNQDLAQVVELVDTPA